MQKFENFILNRKLVFMNVFLIAVFAIMSICTFMFKQVEASTLGQSTDYWNNSVATDFSQGDGTYINPYLISNGAELAFLAQQVNNVANYSVGKHFKLTTDVYLNDVSNWENWHNGTFVLNQWTAIGVDNVGNTFEGNFDGGGFSVYGIFINQEYEVNQGLFGVIGTEGAVQNLGVEKSYIKGMYNVGGVVGYIQGGTITNCYSNCYIDTLYVMAGGIVGYMESGTIINCFNSGNINSGFGSGGGIAGMAGLSTISDCYNAGAITGDEEIGGIVGALAEGSVTGCYNTGDLYGLFSIGGIVGKGEFVIVNNSYNEGTLSGEETVGGVIGYAFGETIVFNCYNTGDITGTANLIGGIIGSAIYNCEIINCYNTGKISGSENIAGICAHVYESLVLNCYNTGSVEADIEAAGGIVGLLISGEINYSYYLSGVTSINGIVQNSSQEKSVGSGEETETLLAFDSSGCFLNGESVDFCNLTNITYTHTALNAWVVETQTLDSKYLFFFDNLIEQITQGDQPYLLGNILVFNANGGESAPSPVLTKGGTASEPDIAPTRNGFLFAGWYKEATCQNSWNFATEKVLENTTLYAKWILDEPLIVSNSGNVNKNFDHANSTLNISVQMHSEISYSYKWFFKASIDASYDIEIIGANTNEYIVNSVSDSGYYKVVVTAESESQTHSNEHEFAVSITKAAANAPTIVIYEITKLSITITEISGAEYSINGIDWQDSNVFLGLQVNTSYTIYARLKETDTHLISDATSITVSTLNHTYYSMNFETNGGSLINPILNVQKGKLFTRPENPVREGYVFVGWFVDNNTFQTPYNWNTFANENIILYAAWEEVTIVNLYTVTFISNGSVYETQNVVAGNTPKKPVDPMREGYTFVAWCVDSELNSTFNFAAGSVLKNITLYAKFVEETYDLSGGVLDDEGNPISFAAIYIKQGNTVFYSSLTDENGNFTLENISANIYNIIVTTENGFIKTEIININSHIHNYSVVISTYRNNSVLEIEENTRDVLVGGLNELHSEKDKEIAKNGGLVEFKVIVVEKDSVDALDIKVAAENNAQQVGGLFDIRLFRTLAENGAQANEIRLTETPTTIKIYIPLLENEIGKSNYVIYRIHNAVVETITTTENANGEKIALSADGKSIILSVKNFSYFAVGFDKPADGDSTENPTNLLWLWILLIAVGIVSLFFLLYILIKNDKLSNFVASKKNKNSNNKDFSKRDD